MNGDRPHERAELELPLCHCPVSVAVIVKEEIGMGEGGASRWRREEFCNLRDRERTTRRLEYRHCERSEVIHASARGKMDCFAEPVIGRAFARPVGSQ
jgi:hypothetical protein